MVQKSVTIIGAGRVGNALGKAFYKAGIKIDLVISRTEKSAASLANHLHTSHTRVISSPISSELALLTVPDAVLQEIVNKLHISDSTIVAHTAGSFSIDVFSSLNCSGSGVLYPFQTFSAERDIELSKIPFFIEADSNDSLARIRSYAECISNMVYDSKLNTRQQVHIAGVFVNNFVNHINGLGIELVERAGFQKEIVDHLIKETMEKLFLVGPEEAQTGPAIRNDINTIEKHLELLSFSSQLSDIYKVLTESIIKKSQELNNGQF